MLTADFLPKLGSVSRFSVGSAASGKKLADPVAIDRFGRAADGLGSTRRVVALLLLFVLICADSRQPRVGCRVSCSVASRLTFGCCICFGRMPMAECRVPVSCFAAS